MRLPRRAATHPQPRQRGQDLAPEPRRRGGRRRRRGVHEPDTAPTL